MRRNNNVALVVSALGLAVLAIGVAVLLVLSVVHANQARLDAANHRAADERAQTARSLRYIKVLRRQVRRLGGTPAAEPAPDGGSAAPRPPSTRRSHPRSTPRPTPHSRHTHSPGPPPPSPSPSPSPSCVVLNLVCGAPVVRLP